MHTRYAYKYVLATQRLFMPRACFSALQYSIALGGSSSTIAGRGGSGASVLGHPWQAMQQSAARKELAGVRRPPLGRPTCILLDTHAVHTGHRGGRGEERGASAPGQPDIDDGSPGPWQWRIRASARRGRGGWERRDVGAEAEARRIARLEARDWRQPQVGVPARRRPGQANAPSLTVCPCTSVRVQFHVTSRDKAVHFTPARMEFYAPRLKAPARSLEVPTTCEAFLGVDVFDDGTDRPV
ncbi:hypothetical protein AcW1_008827 [Taiwanofungus camphoratus]|nr:hypothetical protein AcW1_008827 [Antrodia cinnamomea]